MCGHVTKKGYPVKDTKQKNPPPQIFCGGGFAAPKMGHIMPNIQEQSASISAVAAATEHDYNSKNNDPGAVIVEKMA